MDILSMTALELGRKIKAKEITVKEAVEACLKQIDKVEDKCENGEVLYYFPMHDKYIVM